MSDRLATLTREKTSTWLDDLSRQQLADGSFAALVRDHHVTGAAISLAAFAKAITNSDVYQAQIRELALREAGVDESLRALTAFDARWACDVLQEVYAAGSDVDGRVGVDLDPRCAHDTDRIIAEARALWWLVDRPNLVVGIIATRQGLPAITACLAEGISVTPNGPPSGQADVLADPRWQRLAAADATPPLWTAARGDIPNHDVADLEADGVAMFNTAWHWLDHQLGKALRDIRATP